MARDQRERLAAGMIAAVAEHGYNSATVAHVIESAGVSRRTFYLYFASKRECYLSTYDLIAAFLHQAASAAAAEYSEWSDKIRAALGAMLDALAANPDLVCFCLVVPPAADREIAERQRTSIECLLRALATALPADLVVPGPAQATEENLVGGVSALIARKVKIGEGKALAELLPEVMELALGPYVGREEAMRIARGEAQ